jgi:serpin B
VAVLLALLGRTVAVPAGVFSESIRNSDDYDDDDLFVPVSDKENFDVFDWELCKHLSAQEPGNLVVSPVSIKLVLAMLYEGAAGNTASELERVLRLPSRLQTRKRFSAILNSLLTTNSEYLLDVATRMYVREGEYLRPRFSKILSTFYNASIQNIDFGQSRKAAQAVNSWVSEVTQGKIKSMFSEDTINPSTVMLLVNAIYFKGVWRYPFNENYTREGVFYVTPTQSVTVPFMRMERDLYWSESVELDSAILRLPYSGNKYSMFIVLPNKRDGLNKLLTTVTPALLRNQLFHMSKGPVDVRLPRFSFEFTGQLGDALQALGIRDLFSTAAANLPGVARDRNLYVSKIIQKAGLEVNEEGTTAFASTGMELINKFGGDVFHATHPFMFFIQDETTGTVTFVGKLINPSAGSLSVRMHHQPSVTGIQARHEALHSSFDVDGRHWQAPGVTLTTPRSPKPPVSRTTANDGRDANVIADDPEFAHKAWEYIRSQLLRL